MKQFGNVRQTSGVPVVADFANSNGTPLVIDITSGTGYYLDSSAAVQPLAGGGGGGAPTGATYLTLSLNGSLTAERVLTAGTAITFADTGANGTLTVSVQSLDSVPQPVASVQFNQQQALQFRVENRTSDPASPSTGQIWLRTDL